MNSGFHIRTLDGDRRPSRAPSRKTRERLRAVWTAPHAWGLWLIRQGRSRGWKTSLLFVIGGVGGLGILYVAFLWLTLPSIDEQSILAASQSTVITDRNGVELYRVFGEEDRTIIPGTDIPETTKQAIIAIEDRRYFDRGCIDVRALARAVFSLGKSGGASTLTRQLARNALDLQRENIVSRKLKELILGCQLESNYSKEDLLSLYLNWIPFGQNAYGVQQASSRYFGKDAKSLTLAESAVLASLPQLPSYYSPYGRHVRTSVSDEVRKGIIEGRIRSTEDIDDKDVTIGLLGTVIGSGAVVTASGTTLGPNALYVGGRADQVLRSMQDQGYIDDAARKKAVAELMTLEFRQVREDIRAPHFVLWVKDRIETMFADSPDKGLLEQGGLTITTTLDWNLQQIAEEVIAAHREDIEKRFMGHNIALVAVHPETREILAYVGNTDYADATKEGKIDMAQVPRQPGSSFKAFVYAAAFQNGYGPATVLYDVPTKFGEYQPQNFEGSFWGLTSARRALGGSRNIPAVKAYFLGGEEDEILNLVERMGVVSAKANKPTLGYGAALAIGAAEVPLTEMVEGYATLGALGMHKPLNGLLKVTDRRGALLFSPDEAETLSQGEQVMDPRVAYEVTSILSDPGARPTEYWRSMLTVPGTEAAAKTGTSNKCLEWDEKKVNCLKRKPDNVWTLGYSPALAAGVWVGNATSEPLSDKADGLTVAAPIWKDFMAKAHKVLKPAVTSFPVPDGIVEAQVSLLSGELPTECTPVALRRSDVFLAENAPVKDDPACLQLEVDRVTGLLASDSCPPEAREVRSFLAPYNAAGRLFPQWDTDVQKWAAPQAMENPRAGSGLTLFLAGSGGVLPLPIAPTQKCDISLTPGRSVKPSVSIVSPAPGDTAGYPSFRPQVRFSVGSSIRQVEYAVDGKPVALVISAPFDPPLRIPRSIDSAGTHTLTVTVTDQYYNVATAQTTFAFSTDRSGPDIRMTSPANGAEIPAGTPLLIRAESDDPDGNVKYVELYVDSQLIVRKPLAPYEITWPGELPPGEHTVRAIATDLSGGSAEDEVRITVK